MSQTLLLLQPGGQRFGPFAGTITIGADARRSQVVLPPGSGAQPAHAMLTDTGTGWQLQPASIGAALFLRKPDGRVLSVTTAVQVDPGDHVVVGSRQGPALLVQRMAAQPGAAPGAPPPGRAGGGFAGSQHLNQGAFAREARRQVESTLVTLPMGREIYRFWTRFSSGALFRPRYIIGAIVALVALFGAGCVSCAGIVAAAIGLR
jgi:hypothetical protein